MRAQTSLSYGVVKSPVAPPGRVTQMLDFSELELRVLANLGLTVKGDLHQTTAEAILRT